MALNRDFWLSLCLLGLCSIAAVLTTGLPRQGMGMGAGPGPDFVPWLMIVATSVFSLLLFWRSQREGRTAEVSVNVRLLAKLGSFLAMMIAYAMAYELVGYLVSSLVFFVVALLSLGERRLLHLMLIPPGLILSVYFVFSEILEVYMP